MSPIEIAARYLTALCIWREARGNPKLWLPIFWVIKNRIPVFGRDCFGVILKPYAFSSFLSSDPNCKEFPQPANQADWDAWVSIWGLVDGNALLMGADPTGGAVFYESEPTPPDKPWFAQSKLTLTVGNTRFYRA